MEICVPFTRFKCFVLVSGLLLLSAVPVKRCDSIEHFTVVSLVTWPWIVSEAGVDLVLIETSLLFICKSCCSYAN